MECFKEALLEKAAVDDPKFKKIMADIEKEIDECQDENIKRQKDKGNFLSTKAKQLMTKIGTITALIGTVGLGVAANCAVDSGFTHFEAVLAAASFALIGVGTAICILVMKKPSKEQHLLEVARQIIQFNDKLARNKALSDSLREKIDAQSRRLLNKIYKAQAAINHNRTDFENYDYNMAADVRIINKLVELDPMSNTTYENNKETIDNALRIVNSKYDSILKEVAKKIKSDHKTNENIKDLSVSDIENAYGLHYSQVVLTGTGQVEVYLFIVEKDAIDRNLAGIPAIFGKVVRVEIRFGSDNSYQITYSVTNTAAY